MSKQCDWSAFDVDVDKNSNDRAEKGIKFERFVELLLTKVPFFKRKGAVWTHTEKESHDGKRDFELIKDDGVIAWGECKNYKKPLSINILSPTLIMSVIEDIDEVYIFSLNKLNKTFASYIEKFCYSTSKRVYLFADDFLELITFNNLEYLSDNELILSIKGWDDYDPNIYYKKHEKLETLSYISTFENDKIKKQDSLSINECFYLNIEICNHFLSNIRLTVFSDDIKNNKLMMNDNHQNYYKTIELGVGEIYSFKCLFQIKSVGYGHSALYLPRFYYQYETLSNNYKSNDIKLPRQIIRCSNINYVPMIGHHLDVKGELLKLPSPIKRYIKGGSGLGKSRILRELQKDLIFNGQNPIFVDFSNLKPIDCVKKLLLSLSRLDGCDDKIHFSSFEDDVNDLLFYSVKYILSLDERKILENTVIINKCFNNLIKSDTFLIIDNLQNASPFLRDIINEFNCSLVVSVNTDLDDYDFQDNEGLESNNDIICELEKFDNKLSRLFLYEALGKDSDEIVEKIIRNNPNNTPLNLFHLVRYLIESEIVVWFDGKYILQKEIELNNAKTSLFSGEEIILNKRFDCVEKTNPTLNQLFYIVAILGEIDLTFFSPDIKKSISKAINKELLQNKNGIIAFTHQKLQTYYRDRRSCDDINLQLLALNYKEKEEFALQLFILYFYKWKRNKNFDINGIAFSKKVFSRKLYRYCNESELSVLPLAINNAISALRYESLLTSTTVKEILDFAKWYVFIMQSKHGFGASLQHYNIIIKFLQETVINEFFDDNEINQDAYFLYREYFNCLIEQKRFYETIEESNELLKILSNCPDTDDKFCWLAMLHNRCSIARDKSLNPDSMEQSKVDLIETEYKAALECDKNDSKQRNKSIIQIDYGYHYYNIYTLYDKKLAISFFEKGIGNGNEFNCQSEYHKVLIQILYENYDDALKIINETLSHDRDKIYDYFYNKLLIARVYVKIFIYNKSTLKNAVEFESIKNDLNSAKESIIKTRFNNKYSTILFLKSYIYEMSKDYESAIREYILALSYFCKYNKETNYKLTQKPLYYTICERLFKLGFNEWNRIIFDDIIKNIVNEFSSLSDKALYFKNAPKGIIYDVNSGGTFPSL